MRLVSRIHKELLQLNNKKITYFLNGQKRNFSLVQWLRLHMFNAGMKVQSLAGELRFHMLCRRKIKIKLTVMMIAYIYKYSEIFKMYT